MRFPAALDTRCSEGIKVGSRSVGCDSSRSTGDDLAVMVAIRH